MVLTHPCCCCLECQHVRIDNECCQCVPEEVCASYYFDDEFEEPYEIIFEHDEDGCYLELSIAQPAQGDPPYYYRLKILKDENEDCIWRLQASYQQDFSVIDQEHEELKSNPNVGCLTRPDDMILVENWKLYGTSWSTNGDLVLRQKPLTPIPEKEDPENPGEKIPICQGCDCFESCMCLRYNIKYYEEDESHPDGRVTAGTTDVRAWACWDKTVGDYGGWRWVFPKPVEGDDCEDGDTVILELKEDENGDCEYVLTADQPQWLQVPYDGTVTVTACKVPEAGMAWKYEKSFLRDITYHVTRSPCTDTCPVDCCQDVPDVLHCLVEADNDHEDVDPIEFDLVRQDCSTPTYAGTTTFPWDCPEECTGTGQITVRVVCIGCDFNYVDSECQCECDETQSPPGIGCFTLQEFSSANFQCDDPADGDFGGIGSEPQQPALCGIELGSGRQYYASCEPLIAMFRSTGWAGIGQCLDRWTITVFE